MHLDVLDLRNFYYRTGLGRVAQKAIRSQMQALWPSAPGMTVAGFGFAVPLLRPYLDKARRVIALMPGQQGVMPWPHGQANVAVLCEENHWPLANGLVDRLVVLHGLEISDNPFAVLAEANRVLAEGGRALFIVPNRRGLWARREGTPFSFGRPYSLGQIEAQIAQSGFTPERHASALYAPPTARRFWLRTSDLWEEAGQKLAPRHAGGVLMVEASKQVPSSLRPGLSVRERRPLRVLDALPVPEAKPA